MKRVVLMMLALALLWTGYWFWQAQSLRGSLEGWFADRVEDGWEASYSELAIRGFPNRLDVTFTDLVLANPDNETTWEAPFFQMLSLVYDPGHWIFVWPNQQKLGTAEGTYQITSDGFRASLVIKDRKILRTNLEAAILNLSGPTDLAMAGLNFGVAVDDLAPERLKVGLSVESIAGNGVNLGPTNGETVDSINLRAELTFDEVWTIDALKDEMPQPTAVKLPLADYKAGKVELKATGDWDVDSQGRLHGTGTLRTVNWRELIDNAEGLNRMPEGIADFIADTLGLLGQLSGSRESLDLTFRFDKGTISLGIIPLGRAPRLRFD